MSGPGRRGPTEGGQGTPSPGQPPQRLSHGGRILLEGRCSRVTQETTGQAAQWSGQPTWNTACVPLNSLHYSSRYRWVNPRRRERRPLTPGQTRGGGRAGWGRRPQTGTLTTALYCLPLLPDPPLLFSQPPSPRMPPPCLPLPQLWGPGPAAVLSSLPPLTAPGL